MRYLFKRARPAPRPEHRGDSTIERLVRRFLEESGTPDADLTRVPNPRRKIIIYPAPHPTPSSRKSRTDDHE